MIIFLGPRGLLFLKLCLLVAVFKCVLGYRHQHNEKPTRHVDLSSSTKIGRTPVPLSTVYVAGGPRAKVYINGKLKARVNTGPRVAVIRQHLKKGDVIAIRAYRRAGRRYGVVADAYINGQHFITGHPEWKAHAVNPSYLRRFTAWKKKNYKSCHWPSAIVRRHDLRFPRSSPAFPYQFGAQYAWASGATGQNRVVLFRLVVGGESCSNTAVSSVSSVSFAGDYRAWLYVNGKLLRVASHGYTAKVRVKLMPGDVVALKCLDGRHRYGVIADIAFGQHHVSTGQRGWKAIKGNVHSARNPTGWKTGNFNSCGWPESHIRLNPPRAHRGWNGKFPRGAKYVWARRVTGKDVTLLRYVVGGENCGPVVRQSTITAIAGYQAWVFLNGLLLRYVQSSRQIIRIRQTLKKGDVISIQAKGNGGSFGVAADIFMQGKHIVTGVGEWKAIKGSSKNVFNPYGWRSNKFNACYWPKATTFGNAARSLQSYENVKHIWARKCGRHDTVLLRYVVGSEKCDSGAYINGAILFGGNIHVKAFINGKAVTKVSRDGAGVSVAQAHLKGGDVISMIVRHSYARSFGSFGVIASVFFDGLHHASGSNDWKAAIASPYVPSSWKLSSFKACNWAKATAEGKEPQLEGLSAEAQYIWAKGGNDGATIFVRYVIGGENCSGFSAARVVPSVSVTPSASASVSGTASPSASARATATASQSVSVTPSVTSSPSSSISPSARIKPGRIAGASEERDGVMLSSDNGAVLYIDGKEMGKVRSWREVLSLHMSLESGTVIGIEAYDSGAWFGVKADVVVGGVHFGTGGSGWKATTRLNKQELTEGLWAKQSGNSCKWKVPIGRPDGNEKFKSLGPAFPGRTNSKFVWASGAMEGESAYFRFVVGGENC